MSVDSKRDAYYDNLRCILMFIVVLCHGLEQFRSMSALIGGIHYNLLIFVMPLFVFISGFFAKSMGKADNPKRSRILNLFLLYFIVQLVKCTIAGSFTLIKPLYGNWYLICLIIWYIILPLFSGFKAFAAVALTVLLGLLIGFETGSLSILQISRMVCFFPFFLLGYYLNNDHLNRLKNHFLWGLMGFIICSILLYYLSKQGLPLFMFHGANNYSDMKLSPAVGVGFRALWYILAVFFCVSVLYMIPTKNNALTVIGTRALAVYIFHTCLYYFITKHTSLISLLKEKADANLLLIGLIVESFAVTILFGTAFFTKLINIVMNYDFSHFKQRQDPAG